MATMECRVEPAEGQAGVEPVVEPADGGELGELYRSLAKSLERIVRSRVQAPEPVIEEACQFAWSRLVYHRARVHEQTAMAWLVTTAIHEAFKLLHRSRRDVSLELALEQGREPMSCVPGPSEVVEMRARLDELGALRQRQRRVMWLRAVGFNYEEIARHENCTTRTIERQLERARRALKVGGSGP